MMYHIDYHLMFATLPRRDVMQFDDKKLLLYGDEVLQGLHVLKAELHNLLCCRLQVKKGLGDRMCAASPYTSYSIRHRLYNLQQPLATSMQPSTVPLSGDFDHTVIYVGILAYSTVLSTIIACNLAYWVEQ